MIRSLLMLCLAVFFPVEVFSQPIRAYAYTDSDLVVNKPIMGTLEVEHPYDETIDKMSIKLKDQPLAAEQIKEVRYSPKDPLTLTIYRFQLPPMNAGPHELGVISVKVGDKIYHTAPSTFEVRKARPMLQQQYQKELPSQQVQPKSKDGKPTLILEAFVEPNNTLYPGQRTRVGYRYYYDHSINATKEELPLLEAEGFKKIGGKNTRSAQDKTLSLLEVSQEIEAVKPGEYTFGPSHYEGVALDADGQEIQPSLKSEAPAITINVTELPEKLKPPSYKNAIGLYTFETKLDSTPDVEVGEKMLLRVIIRGAPLEGVELPDLCCQPGIAGRFHFSDIPPAPILKDNTRQFVVDIRPIDAEIREIPSVEFSFFNPKKAIYEKVYSNPIPIKVKPIILEEETASAEQLWPKMNTTPRPIAIAGLKELRVPLLPVSVLFSWWGLLSVPIAAGLLFFQLNLREAIAKMRAKQKLLSSEQILKMLEKCPPGELPAKIRECFLLKLVESGFLEEPKPYEELANEGIEEKVKQFLRKVDASHYADTRISADELIREAHILYREISE